MNGRVRAQLGAEALRRQIESRIETGVLGPGARLPTERSLAADFGIGRNTVRAVLSEIQAAGLIERHVGRGTFVRLAGEDESAVSLHTVGFGTFGLPLDVNKINPIEVMEARLLIEPQLARLIVIRASDEELETLTEIVEQSAVADSMSTFEFLDHKLHRKLAAASKNQCLIGIVDDINKVRQSRAWSALRRRGLTEARKQTYQADHEAIVSALVARDGDRAQQAIADHLNRVHRNLLI